MRMTQLFVPTLKEAPREAELPSHQLLLRAGFIRKLAAGIYQLLPLGLRSLRKVEAIIRQEMTAAGAQEVLLPAVQPAELWEESGRWEKYGPELLRFVDRKGARFALGPTHEEVITGLVRHEVRSYRDLPLNLFQIQAKFRDEIRPRAGLLRGREFIMKDAYSFDADLPAARRSYQSMFEAYTRIFTRCGLTFRAVEADTGAIGGSASHEFHVLAETGEDSIVSCSACDYTANTEKAEIRAPDHAPSDGPRALAHEVETPQRRTVEEVTRLLKIQPSELLKTLLFESGDTVVAVVVPGDREVNPIKVRSVLGVDDLELATPETVRRVTGAPVGFAGPVGLHVPVWLDNTVPGDAAFVVGANKADTHLAGVVPARDFSDARRADLVVARADDACGRCGAPFRFYRGIEVGHVFLLGTRYSIPMGATFLDADGKEAPMVMGCYGIGVTRILAAAIEQRHDDGGIQWPIALAPFEVAILALGLDEATLGVAQDLTAALESAGVEVLLDDRDERPGVKFKDADLIGLPLQVIVGRRGLAEGVVEVKDRATGARNKEPVETAAAALAERIVALRRDSLAEP